MRIFVTGASGWIGSAAIPQLLAAGHQVLGLARSEAAAATIAGLGAEVHRGSLDDVGSLRAGAENADGVVHLGYHHDFSQMELAAQLDRQAITAFGEVLQGTGGPLVVAAGVAGMASGRPATELDRPDPSQHPRIANGDIALQLADRGVRSAIVRFAPTVHGPGDHGFVATLVQIAREKGVSGYVGDGSNQWAAVHRLDAADLLRRVVDDAPAGSAWHAIGEQGVPTREIAEAIGRGLDLPVRSVPGDQATTHFGWLGAFFGMDARASNDRTRATLGWQPTRQGLIADLEAGAYFPVAASRATA